RALNDLTTCRLSLSDSLLGRCKRSNIVATTIETSNPTAAFADATTAAATGQETWTVFDSRWHNLASARDRGLGAFSNDSPDPRRGNKGPLFSRKSRLTPRQRAAMARRDDNDESRRSHQSNPRLRIDRDHATHRGEAGDRNRGGPSDRRG